MQGEANYSRQSRTQKKRLFVMEQEKKKKKKKVILPRPGTQRRQQQQQQQQQRRRPVTAPSRAMKRRQGSAKGKGKGKGEGGRETKRSRKTLPMNSLDKGGRRRPRHIEDHRQRSQTAHALAEKGRRMREGLHATVKDKSKDRGLERNQRRLLAAADGFVLARLKR